MNSDFPMWAMQSTAQTNEIEKAKTDNERLYLIFSCKNLAGQTHIHGFAEVVSIPCESSIAWPIAGPWDRQPCFKLKWLVTSETFKIKYPGCVQTGPYPSKQLYGITKYLEQYTKIE